MNFLKLKKKESTVNVMVKNSFYLKQNNNFF